MKMMCHKEEPAGGAPWFRGGEAEQSNRRMAYCSFSNRIYLKL